jgi:hypothetical protein
MAVETSPKLSFMSMLGNGRPPLEDRGTASLWSSRTFDSGAGWHFSKRSGKQSQ